MCVEFPKVEDIIRFMGEEYQYSTDCWKDEIQKEEEGGGSSKREKIKTRRMSVKSI